MYNILVVDDEKIHRKGIISLLEETCPEDMFWEAEDGTGAIEIMENIPCEIVISDIRMTKMDGLALLRRVKELRPKTSFIIISGYAEFSYAKEAIVFDAAAYLLKPVDKKELYQTVCEAKKKQESYKEQAVYMNDMEEQLKETVPAYMEWLLNQYIRSSYGREGETLASLLPMERKGWLLLMRIKTDKKETIITEKAKRDIGYLIKKMLEPDSSITFSVHHELNMLATLVLSEREPEEKRLWSLYEEMKTWGETYFAVSRMQEHMQQCGMKVFQQAYGVLAYSFYEDKHILFAEKEEENKKNNPGEWNTEQLVGAIQSEKTEEAEKIYERMLEEAMHSKKVSPEMLKRRAVFLFYRILRSFEPFMEKEEIQALNEKDSQLMDVRWYSQLLRDGKYMIFRIVQCLKKCKKNTSNPIEKCREYLENCYMEEITLEIAAGKFHFNPSYLSTLFKQNFGSSFSEYLSNIRMEKAVERLLGTNDKVKEIAGSVGYRDSNYFIRTFKKKYGYTPDEFRKRGITAYGETK